MLVAALSSLEAASALLLLRMIAEHCASRLDVIHSPLCHKVVNQTTRARGSGGDCHAHELNDEVKRNKGF